MLRSLYRLEMEQMHTHMTAISAPREKDTTKVTAMDMPTAVPIAV